MKQIPDAITKRDILHGQKKLSSAEKITLGEAFLKEGWTSDAVDFLTDSPEKLTSIKTKLIEEGNVFLLLKIFRVLGVENNAELLLTAQNAEAQEKYRYAIKGYEKLELIEKAEALKAIIADDGDMKTALNSVFIPKSEEEREEEVEE